MTTTPYLAIEHKGGEPLVLFGSGARFTAAADGILTVRPVGDVPVPVRFLSRGTNLRMNGGESLSITVAAGDIIEIF
ncbi:hypothetical protein LB557_02040 [Mesorhizobium sp. BR115XR7A]|uniref:hypothetical protein n=1 Tax=Mesorhizobium sp. BR115XR7A TaxID=2876645 RepID=UPI001CCECF05|nr:hypothetical protein [Mesorhizobium sp. BR115XR7A]MBZ9904788.1 hypothetical protein [Mesorhizobium sp. BR115XR7A]MBZ9933029.1 hypothetical protein [Mesorhizobium sp. BR1-1-5]